MRATTIRQAYNTFNPRPPIKPEQLRNFVENFYVVRPGSPVSLMETQLTFTDQPIKLLFVGHRGSGKSSELIYLTHRLRPEFLTIDVPIRNIFTNFRVTHTEVIFALLLRLLQLATDEKVVDKGLVNTVWENLLEDSYRYVKQAIFGNNKIPADDEIGITTKVKTLAVDLEFRLPNESYTRIQVNEKFGGRESDLIQRIDDISAKLGQKVERRLLFVVEDLDKLNRESTLSLFRDYASTLTSLSANTIYTFPVWLRYSNDYPDIRKNFSRTYALPNISLKERSGAINAAGWQTMRQVITNRADPTLFSSGAMDKLIALSGGNLLELILMAQEVMIHVGVDQADQVEEKHILNVHNGRRDEYAVILSRQQINLLREQYEDRDKHLDDLDQTKQELLYNGSLMEYANHIGPWADVNPVVVSLLTRESDASP